MYWEYLVRPECGQGVPGHSDMGRNGMLGDSRWAGRWERWCHSWWNASHRLPSVWCHGSLSLVLAVVSAEMVTITWSPTAPALGSGRWLGLLPSVFQKLCITGEGGCSGRWQLSWTAGGSQCRKLGGQQLLCSVDLPGGASGKRTFVHTFSSAVAKLLVPSP